jgi:hypothetical protein
MGQYREGFAKRMTDSAAHPNAIMSVIMREAGAPSVTEDRVVSANWTSPRQ